MEENTKMYELRRANLQYKQSIQRYRSNFATYTFTVYNGDVPLPTSGDSPDVWHMYADVIQNKQKKEELEAALQRCIKSVEYCLKSIIVERPIDEQEYRMKIQSFSHWKNITRLSDTLSLANPMMFNHIVNQVAIDLFNLCGGDFSASQAQCVNGVLTVYFIK